MFRILLITFIFVFAAGSPAVKPLSQFLKPFQGRIVSGQKAAIENHPWQVSVQMLGIHYCGGSIISDQVILTAGHCAEGAAPGLIFAHLGSNLTKGDGIRHAVSEIILHENFKRNKFGVPTNDIALLILEKPIEFNNVAKSILLFDQDEETQVGAIGTLTGWGSLKEGGIPPSVLYTVDVPMISKDSCDKAYKIFGGLPDGEICAAYPEGGKDSCQGDSGGPLVINGRQAGIVSWGNGCAQKGWPGVYTEIAAYRQWIRNNSGI